MAQAPVAHDINMIPHSRPMTASPRMLHPGQNGVSGPPVFSQSRPVSEVKQYLVEQTIVMRREIAESTEKAIEAFVQRMGAVYSGVHGVTESEALDGFGINAPLLPHSSGGTGEMPQSSPPKQRATALSGDLEEWRSSLRSGLRTPSGGWSGNGPGQPPNASPVSATGGSPAPAPKFHPPAPALHVSTPRDSAPRLPGYIFSDNEDDGADDDDAVTDSLALGSQFESRKGSMLELDGALYGDEGGPDADSNARRRAVRHQSEKRKSISNNDDNESDDDYSVSQPKAVFADASQMKEKIRAAVSKNAYNVTDFYWETGVAQAIARSTIFENLTLGIIFANALWISVDTDYNDADLLMQAEPPFIVAENLFCLYFSFEWTVRFLSFKKKRMGLIDFWFVFDSIMAALMVAETWIMTLVLFFTNSSNTEAPPFDPAVLKLFRLLRLSRMARMARLLRAMPELMILIKGMFVATRSVLFTLGLLVIIMYVFAIAICQLTKDTDTGAAYFPTVPESIISLLLRGILPDQAEIVWACMYDESTGPLNRALFAFLMLCFILVGSLTVMNMLVGVLCEVVSVVSNVEKESLVVNFVKSQLLSLLTNTIDTNGDKRISKDEFHTILFNKKAAMVLEEVGVDVVGLVDFQDFIFRDTESLSFASFMEVVLQLRGSNVATVRDIVDLRKFMTEEIKRMEQNSKKLVTRTLQGSHTPRRISSSAFPVSLFAQPANMGGGGGVPLDLHTTDDGTPPRPVALNRPPRAPVAEKVDVHKLLAELARNPPGALSNPVWMNDDVGLGLARWPSAPIMDQFDDLDIEEVMAEHNIQRQIPTMDC